jgi:hypothetical protein
MSGFEDSGSDRTLDLNLGETVYLGEELETKLTRIYADEYRLERDGQGMFKLSGEEIEHLTRYVDTGSLQPAPFWRIHDHPLPLTQERADELQQENPTFTENPMHEHLSVDALHETYSETLAENDEWRLIDVHVYGHENVVYAWNHQMGFGLAFHASEGSFLSFADCMARYLDTDSSHGGER